MLCTKVAQDQLCLPDERRLLFRVQGTPIQHLDAQAKEVRETLIVYLFLRQ